MLLCDFGNLAQEVVRLQQAGVRILHLDIMDGVFVPNFTYGMTVVQAIRGTCDMVLDCHLMMVHPERYVEQFRAAGADVITVHQEAVNDLAGIGRAIRATGALAGVALNPDTPVETVAADLNCFDLALVMSVQPGFGGQAFRPEVLAKLGELREVAPDILLEIDGGVSTQTVARCVQAGAQLLVAGSAVFRAEDYGDAVDELSQLAHNSLVAP